MPNNLKSNLPSLVKNLSGAILIALLIFLIIYSVSGTSDKKTETQFSVGSNLLSKQTLNLSFTDGNKSKNFTNNDFQPRENPTTGKLATPIIEISTDGKLTVEFQLLDSETGQQISEGNFQVDLRKDRRYSFYILSGPAETDPIQGCFGCEDYFSFGYSTDSSSSDNDSLYVLLGVNSISNPVDY